MSDPASESAERPPRRKTRRAVLTALAAAAVTAAAGGTFVMAGGTGASAPVVDDPASTVPVTRADLVETQQVDGELGYAGSYFVPAGKNGTVTWLPHPGDTLTRGQQVFGRDNQLVPLLYGATPFWRELAAGVADGPDVQILEQNLKALGYGRNLAIDNRFTRTTTAAIKRWQKKRGAEQTGKLELGDALVLPGPIRVAEVQAKIGAPAAAEVLTATSTNKQVTVDLPVTRSALAVKGGAVTVGLPDGKSTTGKITAVGTTATKSGDQGEEKNSATVPVTVTLDNPAVTGTLDGAPVTVGFRGIGRRGVLTVPVNALLALAEGGYGVETVAAGGRKNIVTVELGLFAGGRVEITGRGLAEGTRVGVPTA